MAMNINTIRAELDEVPGVRGRTRKHAKGKAIVTSAEVKHVFSHMAGEIARMTTMAIIKGRTAGWLG